MAREMPQWSRARIKKVWATTTGLRIIFKQKGKGEGKGARKKSKMLSISNVDLKYIGIHPVIFFNVSTDKTFSK